MNWLAPNDSRTPDRLQKLAFGLMGAITLLTFLGTNLQALLWQSSDWLVSTVLPAVVVDLTNEERSEARQTPLNRNPTLDAAATLKAEHMAKNEYFAHYAPDGTSPWHFFSESGYRYAHAGENLAIHFTDSAEVVEAWMQSPAHRQNIIDQKYTEIGVGTARGTFDGYDTIFVVQLFGTPAAQPAPAPAPAPTPVAADEQVVSAGAVNEDSTTTEALAAIRAELDVIQAEADALAAQDEVVSVEESTATVASQTVTPPTSPEPSETVTEPTVPTTPLQASVDQETRETVAIANDVLVIESELATSSGLAVASIVEPIAMSSQHAGETIASIVTRPNLVLDVVYSLLVSALLVLVSVALWGEARRLHYVQVAYSLLLLAGMGGLWFTHTLLTSGAVVV